MVAILTSAAFRAAVLIRGTRLFQCGYRRMWRLFEGGAYVRLGAY